MIIKTASWFTKLPADHLRVGISRGTPRGQPAGYKKFPQLAPGPWFNSSTIPEYLRLYGEILAGLDPDRVVADLAALAPGRVPTLLCFESPHGVNDGSCWCHRHLAAKWLEDRLGITIEEVGFPKLDRFAKLRLAGIEPPTY